MVELELLQRTERPVAHLGQLELASLELAGIVQRIELGDRFAEIGQRHEDDAGGRKQRSENERKAHNRTRASARP